MSHQHETFPGKAIPALTRSPLRKGQEIRTGAPAVEMVLAQMLSDAFQPPEESSFPCRPRKGPSAKRVGAAVDAAETSREPRAPSWNST